MVYHHEIKENIFKWCIIFDLFKPLKFFQTITPIIKKYLVCDNTYKFRFYMQ